MGGATFVKAVIMGEFSQWADTIDWAVRCDWLSVQVASVVTFILHVLPYSCGSLLKSR